MEFNEAGESKSVELKNQDVLDTVAVLRNSLLSKDIVLEYTFSDNWAFDTLEDFLKEVEKDPSLWIKEKVQAEFKSKANRLSEPPSM